MKKYQLKPGYIPRNVAGEYMAIPVTMDGASRRRLILLNSVSACIWELLATTRTIEELTMTITEEFEVTYQEAYADIEEFLEELQEQQLLILPKINAVS